jgi:hypothetical protein
MVHDRTGGLCRSCLVNDWDCPVNSTMDFVDVLDPHVTHRVQVDQLLTQLTRFMSNRVFTIKPYCVQFVVAAHCVFDWSLLADRADEETRREARQAFRLREVQSTFQRYDVVMVDMSLGH